MGEVASIEERIAQSASAQAMMRAIEVVKSLERDKSQISDLRWAEEQQDDSKLLLRTFDFSDRFPEGVDQLIPVPVSVSVAMPGDSIDSNLGDVMFGLPTLAKMSAAEPLDSRVAYKMNAHGVKTRPVLDVVTFVPFPSANARAQEQFNPEFFIYLNVLETLQEGQYFQAIAKYGNNVVTQFLSDPTFRNLIAVYADPYHRQPFKARSLISMGAEERESMPLDCDMMGIYIGKNIPGAVRPQMDLSGYMDLFKGLNLDYGHPNTTYDLDGHNPKSGADLSRGRFYSGTELFSLGGPTRGGSLGGEYKGSGSSTTLSLLSGGGGSGYKPPKPFAKPEALTVAIEEGKKRDRVQTESVSGLTYDPSWSIQCIRLKVVGVREGMPAGTIVEKVIQLYK